MATKDISHKAMRRLGLIFFTIVLLTSTTLAEGHKFKIGFTLPLTGPFAEFGAAVRNAVTIAKEEQPLIFDSIELLIEDDQYNGKNALTAFQKLKNVDQADLIMVWGNEPALAVAPVAESSKFPLIAFGQTPTIAAGKKHVLRVLGPAIEFGKPIGRYLTSQHASSVQLILLDNTFYKLVSDSIRSALPDSTSFNVLASVPASELDFRPYLLKVKQNPKDFLGVILSPSQLIPFFKQANELQLANPIFGSTSFESKAVVTEGRQLMNGAVYSHVTVAPDWHESYLKRFGDDIQVSYAAVAHDILLEIGKTVSEQKGKINGDTLLEYMAGLKERHGASGRFFATSSEEHGRYIDFEVTLKKILSGKVIVLR